MGSIGGTVFQLGAWQVSPSRNAIAAGADIRQLEPQAMKVLVLLCERGDAVVSTDELLERCWGSDSGGDNLVHKTITQLRRLLGDSATSPTYIQTIRKRGYRVVAAVAFAEAVPDAAKSIAWTHGSPFRGLEAFDERHAPVFFGRDEAKLALRMALASRIEAGRSMLLMLGPSGSGKSSLVRAGLLPALMASISPAPALVVTCGTFDVGDAFGNDLMCALASVLIDWEVDGAGLFPQQSAASLGQQLAVEPMAVARMVGQRLGGAGTGRALLFVDRLEALFTLPGVDAAQRDCFVRAIDALARGRGSVVVLACRNDFYPQLCRYPALLEGKNSGAHYDVPPPSYGELLQMIRLPAQHAGLAYARDPASGRGLDDLLCDAAAASTDGLPMLQYTLQELYRHRSSAGTLTLEAYRGLGGIEGAIGRRAEHAVAALTERQRASLPSLFSLLVTVGPGDGASGQRAQWAALDTDDARVTAGALVDARLLVSGLIAGTGGFVFAHEAILRQWPRLVDWVAAHRDALQARAPIAALAARWQASGRPHDLLLPPGRQLEQAMRLLELPGMQLLPEQRQLVVASHARARWRTRLRTATLMVIVGLSLLASGLGLRAQAEQRDAQRRREEAEALMEFMLGDLSEQLRPLGRLDLLDRISMKALGYLGDIAQDDHAGLVRRARALQQLAEVQISRGAPQVALRALAAARTLLIVQLEARPRDRGVLLALGANAFWMGNVSLNQNDYPAATHWLRLYQHYADRLHALAPGAAEAVLEQSYAHNSLGTLALQRGDPREAGARFRQSIALKQSVFKGQPGNTALAAELADSMSWAASAAEADGRLSEAFALRERQIGALEKLHAGAAGETLWTFHLAMAWQHLGTLQQALGRDPAATGALARSATLFDAIVRADPGNRTWRANQLYLELQRAQLHAMNDAAAALPGLRALQGRAEALATSEPSNSEWGRLAAVARRELGRALLQAGEPAAAMLALSGSRRRLEQLMTRGDADLYTRQALVEALLVAASDERAEVVVANRHSMCRSALDLLADAAADSNDFRVLDPWTRALACAGDGRAASARARLDSLGYRATQYLAHFSHR